MSQQVKIWSRCRDVKAETYTSSKKTDHVSYMAKEEGENDLAFMTNAFFEPGSTVAEVRDFFLDAAQQRLDKRKDANCGCMGVIGLPNDIAPAEAKKLADAVMNLFPSDRPACLAMHHGSTNQTTGELIPHKHFHIYYSPHENGIGKVDETLRYKAFEKTLTTTIKATWQELGRELAPPNPRDRQIAFKSRYHNKMLKATSIEDLRSGAAEARTTSPTLKRIFEIERLKLEDRDALAAVEAAAKQGRLQQCRVLTDTIETFPSGAVLSVPKLAPSAPIPQTIQAAIADAAQPPKAEVPQPIAARQGALRIPAAKPISVIAPSSQPRHSALTGDTVYVSPISSTPEPSTEPQITPAQREAFLEEHPSIQRLTDVFSEAEIDDIIQAEARAASCQPEELSI